MHNSCLGLSLASRNWESSPRSYLSKQDLCDYSIENWAGGTLGTLLKQEIKPLACNLKRKMGSLLESHYTIESISKLKGKYMYFSSPVTSEPALSPAVPGGRAPGLHLSQLQSKTLNPQGQISGVTDTARCLRNCRVVSSCFSRFLCWTEKLFQSNQLCAVDGWWLTGWGKSRKQ